MKYYLDRGKHWELFRSRFSNCNDGMFFTLSFILGLARYSYKHRCWIIKLYE